MRVVAVVLVVFGEKGLGFKTNWGMVRSEGPLLGTFVVGSSTVKSGWMDRSFISFADGIIIIIIIITIIIIHYQFIYRLHQMYNNINSNYMN